MAKVMISLPDELLERIDAHARRQGMTRSGLVQTLAERELHVQDETLREDVERLLARAGPHGGDSARAVREDRLSH